MRRQNALVAPPPHPTRPTFYSRRSGPPGRPVYARTERACRECCRGSRATADLEREHGVHVDQFVAVRDLGADVRERKELLGQFADGPDHGPADRPPDGQQANGDLRGQARGHGVPVHVAPVLGQRVADENEREKPDQRQQAAPVVFRFHADVQGEHGEEQDQRSGPKRNREKTSGYDAVLQIRKRNSSRPL